MKLTPVDKKILAATLVGEAADQGKKGMTAVAWVLRNRSNDPRFPNDPAAVALQKNQFSANNGGLAKVDTKSKEYKDALAAIDEVFSADQADDPTDGALHYYANQGPNAIAKPSWFDKNAVGTKQIGDHLFASTKVVDPSTKIDTKSRLNVFDSIIQDLWKPAPIAYTRGGRTGHFAPEDGTLKTKTVKTLGVDSSGNPIFVDGTTKQITRDPSKPFSYPGGGQPNTDRQVLPGEPPAQQYDGGVSGDLGVDTPYIFQPKPDPHQPNPAPEGPLGRGGKRGAGAFGINQRTGAYEEMVPGEPYVVAPPSMGSPTDVPKKWTDRVVTERVPVYADEPPDIAIPKGPQGRGPHHRVAQGIPKPKVQTGWKTVKKTIRVQEPTTIVPKVQLTRTLTGKTVPVGTVITTQGGTRQAIVRADGIIVDAKTGKDIAASVRQHFINAGDLGMAARVRDKRSGPLSIGSKTQRTQSSQGETFDKVWAEARG